MDRYEKRFMEQLHNSGAERIRSSRHIVFRLPNGNNFVLSSTPSDWRTWRQAAANLRRALNSSQPNEEPRAPITNKIEQVKTRVRLPGRGSAKSGENFFIKFESSETRSTTGEAQKRLSRFESISDVLIAAQSIPSFWSLDVCGRIRVLQRLTSHFKCSEIVTAMFGRAELKANQKPTADDLANMSHLLWKQLWMNHCDLWGGGGVTALWIEDPELGEVVVEVHASEALAARSDISVIPTKFDSEGTFFAHWPLWELSKEKADRWSQESFNACISYSL